MSVVLVAALAGWGLAMLVGWAAGRVEEWWAPKWAATLWAFKRARSTAVLAAWFAVAATTPSDAPVVAYAASATLGWAIAQGYVLLLLTARR